MPPATPNITDLSEAEDTYLRSCVVNYRSTPLAEKDGFRENCVKYIMRQRGVNDTDPYAYQLIRLKVKNWFQNHAKKGKSVRLPMCVNQGFSPMRVWAMLNEAAIRKSVGERREEADGDDARRLATWNETKKQLWEGLPEANRCAYEKLAEKWAMEGPDEAVKPILAEKCSPSWMRSVASLFWIQCNMALFMYGMYKDKDGVLHAVVYDTSNLWREMDKSMPLFRNVPAWDKDFWHVAWTFFQAILCPELANPETLQVMKASKRNPPAPISFARHGDECPILFKTEEEGKAMNNGHRQEIFREFMKAHYNLAVGRETCSPPWSSMHEQPSKFFEDGMLPEGFVFNDPSHIGEMILIPFFDHVINMEFPTSPDVPPRRFRFYQFERGSGENRTYHPAVYNGIVEPTPPRRSKKTVTVPDFEDPPSPVAGPSQIDENTDTSPHPNLPPVLAPLAAAFASDLEVAKAEVLAEMAAETSAPRDVPLPSGSTATPASRPQRTATSRPLQQLLSNAWLDAEIDASARQSDDESELTEEEYLLPADEDTDDSDEEVEDVLNDLGLGDMHAVSASWHTVLPAVTVAALPTITTQITPAVNVHAGNKVPGSSSSEDVAAAPAAPEERIPIAPAQVSGDVLSRISFLRSLSTAPEYVALLQRMDQGLRSITVVRVQNPVFWATWGHKSQHVPEVIHMTAKKVTQLLTWIAKERAMTGDPAEMQRFCLVVGMCLRDLDLIANADGASSSNDLPLFMSRSSLEPDARGEILAACSLAFTATTPGGGGKGKGRKKVPKAPAGGVSETIPIAPSSEAPEEPALPRRSTRAVSRRT